MDQVNPEGAAAPVETPTSGPDGKPAEAVTPEAAKPVETPAKPESDERKGVAKRLHELSTDRNHWRDLAMKLQQQHVSQAPQAPASDDDAPKTLKDFNYDEKQFLDYSEKRLAARADKAAKEAAQRWRAEQTAIERRARFDERVDAYAKTVDDYHEVVTDATPVSEAMADAIMDSDEAGALMYYLGQNPDEARKLYGLSPAKAGREIQKLEDRLVAERKKAAEKPVSKAPPPVPTIDAVEPSINVSASDPSSDKLDMKSWLKRREKELSKRN